MEIQFLFRLVWYNLFEMLYCLISDVPNKANFYFIKARAFITFTHNEVLLHLAQT